MEQARLLLVPCTSAEEAGLLLAYRTVKPTMCSRLGSCLCLSAVLVWRAYARLLKELLTMFVLLLWPSCRNAPAKKYLAGGLALSAGATWAFLRWCISHARFLSIREVLLSPVAVWYIIITGTAGVAVTYWIDHPDHYKLHNTIRTGLQLVALVFVYNSFPDQGLAIAAVLFLICCAWLVEPTTNLVR
jgi:hypothetical protein